jgi:hypothetical protein
MNSHMHTLYSLKLYYSKEITVPKVTRTSAPELLSELIHKEEEPFTMSRSGVCSIIDVYL